MKEFKFLFIFILPVLFLSCKNFMNGDSFLTELEHSINYLNEPNYDVHITAAAGTGSYKKGSGDKTFKVGDEIDIEFEVNSAYQFLGWDVFSETDENLNDQEIVKFTPSDQPATKIKFLKGQNIYIKPNCDFTPAIIECEPKYNWLGVACDTPIVIKFNTLIDEATLTKENIIITNKIDSNIDYGDYFESIVKDDEEKNITVWTLKPDSSISELFNNKNEQYDINVKILKENIFPRTNNTISVMGENTWYYRINSGEEGIIPVINEVCFYNCGPDADGNFSDDNKLTAADFSEWTVDDCYTNHVKDLYLYIKGYDADSGLNFVNIKGDFVKSTNGKDAHVDGFENRLGNKDSFTFTKEPDENGNYFYEYYTKIDFSEQYVSGEKNNNLFLNDGLIKYTISLVDRAGNSSEAQIFYVIKDTTVTANRIRSYSEAYYNSNGQEINLDNITSEKRIATDGIDTVNLYFTSESGTNNEMQDPFFVFNDTELFDSIKITDIKWGYNLSFNESAVKNENPDGAYKDGAYYTIKRDQNRETYIKITAQDNVGNQSSRIIVIPEKNRIQKIEDDGNQYIISFKNFTENCNVKPTANQLLLQASSDGNNWADSWALDPDNRNETPFKTSVQKSYSYIYALNEYNFDGWKIKGISSGNLNISSDPTAITVDDKYIPKKIANVEISTPVKNEGSIILRTSFSNYEKNNAYECFVGYKAEGMNEYEYSASREFSVPTGRKYVLKPFVYVNGYYKANSAAEEVNVDLTSPAYDNKGPEVCFEPLFLHSKNSALPNYVELYPFVDGTGLNKIDNNYIIEYWFITNPSAGSSAVNYTEEDLSYNSSPKQLKIKVSEYPETVYKSDNTVDELKTGRIRIPLDDLTEFSYTLYVKVTDSSPLKNYSFYSNYANNILLDNDNFVFGYDKNNQKWSVTFNNVPVQDAGYGIYTTFEVYNNSNGAGKWEKSLVPNSIDCRSENRIYFDEASYYLAANENISSDYSDGKYETNLFNDFNGVDATSGKFIRISAYQGNYNKDKINGYYKTQYVYPDYYKDKTSETPAIKIKNKGVQTLDNGVQIFADAPVLVHTFYSSSDYGDNNDLWINHGIETGIKMETSSFTYLKENFNDIPAGKYYKTIVHFADGSIETTGVKVK